MTIDTSPAAQGYGAGQRKGRAVRRASRPAGPGELRKALLFADIDGGTLSRLSADVRIESLQDGDVLFRQGSGVAHLSFVLSGYVKLTRIASSGRQTLIGIRSEGEMIGEAPIGLQGTFSVWQDQQAVRDFAYALPAHRAVIEQTRQTGWYSEELFARFAVTDIAGDRLW